MISLLLLLLLPLLLFFFPTSALPRLHPRFRRYNFRLLFAHSHPRPGDPSSFRVFVSVSPPLLVLSPSPQRLPGSHFSAPVLEEMYIAWRCQC